MSVKTFRYYSINKRSCAQDPAQEFKPQNNNENKMLLR